MGNRYRVEERLGQGGMGAVYRAAHVHIKKSFALKVLHPELTHHAESVKRFEREAIAAARIDHPNVATAIDFGRLPSGEFYLVLDYVQGDSLRTLLRDEGPLDEQRAVRIARQIACALAAAHAAGIVHRDLKPDNVMLVESSQQQELIKVLDFGIAKLRSEDAANEPAITRFGTVFGTPEYMSPEQALGHTVDARSDLYSLGIMLYEMLAGQTPFADEQLVTVLSRQMTEKPAPLTQASSALTSLVMQLLEKDPSARPASAEQLIEQLDALSPPRSVAVVRSSTDTEDSLRVADTMPAPMQTADQPEVAFAPPPARSLYSIPVWAKRQITIAGRPFPWVLMALGSALVTLTVVFTLTVGSLFGGDEPSSVTSASVPSAVGAPADSPKAKQIGRWIVLATQGDRSAIAALEALPEGTNSATIWLAIGAGRAMNKSYGAAIEAYRRAFELDPKVANTPHTQSALFQAALLPESTLPSIELALKYLGERGADLVYAVNEASAGTNPTKLDRKALRQSLDRAELRELASPALKVALELESPKSCTGYRQLLPSATTDGDTRSLKTLRKLTYDRGCGLLKMRDCLPCLRGSNALAEAIEAAKSRPAPTF